MKIGDKIPEILGVTADGTTLKASDFAGKKLVLYFYPKDNMEYISGLKIIPITIDILKELLIKNVTYDTIYSWLDTAYKSTVPDPIWYQKEILEKV